MARQFPEEFFTESRVPNGIDLEDIRQEWLAAQALYQIGDRHLPLPVWAQRPFTEDGQEAWNTLGHHVPFIDANQPLCVYVHVPFCAQRCRFCDCYSFPLRSHREKQVRRYVDRLLEEIRAWASLGTLAARPVSTVHFGGGTPTYLGSEALARLVGGLRAHLAAGAETEWALESTVTELSETVLKHLDALGFTRLHVGVQTLEDIVRERLNRRATARQVFDVLSRAVDLGWVVTVDLIYGLPGQTLDGLLTDIESLAAAGVDGFSLYELQLSSRNWQFARQHGLEGRDRGYNFFLAQVASRFLISSGFRKTLFNHFARGADTNLYFTFPERGEDCLALGTIADGVFEGYHYRHPEYAAYMGSAVAGFPGLEGGLRRTEAEDHLQPLVTALMGAHVPRKLQHHSAFRSLLARWQAAELLVDDDVDDGLQLTASGSWFVGNMISEVVSTLSVNSEEEA
jgi:oxygen-independent coproporphyrinogen-3 oxidase